MDDFVSSQKMKRQVAEDPELAQAAIDDLSYVPNVAATYVLKWGGKTKPDKNSPKEIRRLHNALLEVSLLFIRKTTEFFKPQDEPPIYADSLYAWKFLKNWKGEWVIGKPEYERLHSAVGHITVRGARMSLKGEAKDNWPIGKWTLCSLDAWIRFYDVLPESHVFKDKAPKAELNRQKEALVELKETCRILITNDSTLL